MIKFVSSCILVSDIPKSRDFYENILGQNPTMTLEVHVAYESGFAIWQSEYAHQTIFTQPRNQQDKLNCDNFELYFETEDLPAAEQLLTASGITFIHTMREQPWAQRTLRIFDPDGHIVEVGEPMTSVISRLLSEGLDIETVATRTFMPADIVRAIAQSPDRA